MLNSICVPTGSFTVSVFLSKPNFKYWIELSAKSRYDQYMVLKIDDTARPKLEPEA
jgi:hypothetical protein